MLSRLNHPGRAFTLVEILVVVIIIGIAGALIVPQIGSHDDLKASAAARIVMADLIYAQNRAISTQQSHYVQFVTTTPQSYTLYSPVGTIIQHPVNKTNYAVKIGTGGDSGLTEVALGKVDFGGQKVIVFDALGAPYSYDGTNTTQLTTPGTIEISCKTHKLTITIQPFTGEITVN